MKSRIEMQTKMSIINYNASRIDRAAPKQIRRQKLVLSDYYTKRSRWFQGALKVRRVPQKCYKCNGIMIIACCFCLPVELKGFLFRTQTGRSLQNPDAMIWKIFFGALWARKKDNNRNGNSTCNKKQLGIIAFRNQIFFQMKQKNKLNESITQDSPLTFNDGKICKSKVKTNCRTLLVVQESK